MLQSKSRSGSFDFRRKDHSSSRFSRTLSIPKFCRGSHIGSQISGEALLVKKSSILVNSPKNRINKVSSMQQHMGLQNDNRNQSIENIQSLEANTIVNQNYNAEKLKNEMELEIHTRKIRELEEEVERRKVSESNMLESVVSQTKMLEETKIELEESKIEILNLKNQIERLQILSMSQKKDLEEPHAIEHFDSAKEAFDSLKYELETVKSDLVNSQEAERVCSLKAKNLLDEINVLKNELNLATSAEEKSKKAMDDLALALKEVATEANQTKGKLGSTQTEFEHVKAEAEQLKEMVKIIEDRYEKLLEEAKKEAERQKNIADRLSLEAEESLIAWNGKEKGFVDCIRRNEEERTLAQKEHVRLAQAVSAAKDETTKVRDIMKQALNEANVAKVAASIARDENSQLKDCLAEKDETIHILSKENERLNGELQRLLSKKNGRMVESDNSGSQNNDDTTLKKVFSFDLKELKVPMEPKNVEEKIEIDVKKAEALKGSILDSNSATPESEVHTPPNVAVPQRRWSSPAFAEVSGNNNSEESEQLETPRYDDGDGHEKINHRRRKSALLKRFGDIILRKSAQKKEQASAE